MSVTTKISFGSIFALLTTGASLVAGVPAQAGFGRGPDPAADEPVDSPQQQCARRDTYNDVYYVDCSTFYRQARDLIGQP